MLSLIIPLYNEEGLVDLWHMDDVAIATITNVTPDNSELGNTGAVPGVALNITGKINNAFKFDGSAGNYVSFTDIPAYSVMDGSDSFSISMWQNMDNYPPGAYHFAVKRQCRGLSISIFYNRKGQICPFFRLYTKGKASL